MIPSDSVPTWSIRSVMADTSPYRLPLLRSLAWLWTFCDASGDIEFARIDLAAAIDCDVSAISRILGSLVRAGVLERGLVLEVLPPVDVRERLHMNRFPRTDRAEPLEPPTTAIEIALEIHGPQTLGQLVDRIGFKDRTRAIVATLVAKGRVTETKRIRVAPHYGKGRPDFLVDAPLYSLAKDRPRSAP